MSRFRQKKEITPILGVRVSQPRQPKKKYQVSEPMKLIAIDGRGYSNV